MNAEINQLKKQVKQLRVMVALSTIVIVFMAVASFRPSQENFGIIRAKGLVIEDSAGRDRILLGAPIPWSDSRVRTDTSLVRKHWAVEYEENADLYMGYYKNYKHSAIGMLVMNEDGFDRVMIGDKLADPNIGPRAFEMAGVIWNDKTGWERGGLGVNTLKNGKSRSVVGVDNEHGEAVHLAALEDGTSSISINSEKGRLLMGYSPKDGRYFRTDREFTGLKFLDREGKEKWKLETSQ